MKKKIFACIAIAAAAAVLFIACTAKTPDRKLKIRTDTEAIQSRLPNMDIQECVWVDVNSRGSWLLPAPDLNLMGVIALSDQQVKDMTAAFEWEKAEEDFFGTDKDRAYLLEQYYDADLSTIELTVSSLFTEQNSLPYYYNSFYLAAKEQLLLFVVSTH